MVFRVEVRGDQCSKRQERFFTEARLFGDLDPGAIPGQHPRRNLQTLPGCVNDADRPIATLRSADNLQGSAIKRVKGVEDLNIRMIRAQGIVGVGATIRMSTAWFQPAGFRLTIRGGWQRGAGSSCRCASLAACSEGSS